MNVIFGSGVVALLARHILGPSWTIVPFTRSRFYRWQMPLADNYVIADDQLDLLVKDLTGELAFFNYRRAWSIGGQIVREFDDGICLDWLYKIFGNEYPPHALPYMRSRLELRIYNAKTNAIYGKLMTDYLAELEAGVAKGQVTAIGAHSYVQGGKTYEFDYAVSTIPLDLLLRLMNVQFELRTKPVHYLHIKTPMLDFEGANQLLVVDKMFSFFKAINVAPQQYVLYCHEEIPTPGAYLMAFLGTDFEMIDACAIHGALQLGQMPKLDNLETSSGVFCVGSYAQWDWCADISSCMLRILRYAQRDFKVKPQRSLGVRM